MITDAKVISNQRIGEDIYRLKLSAPSAFKALPGQFINILVSEEYSPLLRRPFSVFSCGKGCCEIVFKVIGEGTRLLAEKKTGDKINYIGPLGNPYPLDLGPGTLDLILVGGGTGAASIYFLARLLSEKHITFSLFQGARKKAQLLAIEEYSDLGAVFATEDGSAGIKGMVTDALKKKLKDNTMIYACGPKPMFKAIQAAAEGRKNVKILASFEEYMGCGMGACLSCVVAVKDKKDFEYKRVCTEGPVFNLDEVEY
jgi:dihydroorotate dehydrogenase electron transfer subunit